MVNLFNVTATGPAAILETPLGEEAPSFSGHFIQMLGSLGAILGIIFLVAFLLKFLTRQRHIQRNQNSTIKILERRAIGPKSALYLIEVLGKVICVAETPAGWTPLTEFSKEGLPAEIQESSPSFKELFKRKISS